MSLVGVGIDVLGTGRVALLLDRYGDRFVRRWFTPAEIAWCRRGDDAAQAFATLLAGKEAAWKALRVEAPGPVPWRSVEVHPDGQGGGRVTVAADLAPGDTRVDVRMEVRDELVFAYAVAWTGVTTPQW